MGFSLGIIWHCCLAAAERENSSFMVQDSHRHTNTFHVFCDQTICLCWFYPGSLFANMGRMLNATSFHFWGCWSIFTGSLKMCITFWWNSLHVRRQFLADTAHCQVWWPIPYSTCLPDIISYLACNLSKHSDASWKYATHHASWGSMVCYMAQEISQRQLKPSWQCLSSSITAVHLQLIRGTNSTHLSTDRDRTQRFPFCGMLYPMSSQ